MSDDPARARRPWATGIGALALLAVGVALGVAVTVLTGDPEPDAAAEQPAAIFAVATAASLVQSPPTQISFRGTVTVINSGEGAVEVSGLKGSLPGLTVTGIDESPRAIPARGQNDVSVSVVAERSICSAGSVDAPLTAPVSLDLTVATNGESPRARTATLQLAGSYWNTFVFQQCARLAEATG